MNSETTWGWVCGLVTAMWSALGYCCPLKRQPLVRMKSFTW